MGSTEKPGLYPENFKKSIQNGGPVASMSEATKATITTEFKTYISRIEDSVKKICEETLELVS